MSFIQRVIRETSKPSWMNTVPVGFGESKTGTLKADEWRSLSTIFLPIALVLLWGKNSTHTNKNVAEKLATHLDHTMSLVQAIVLACYRSTSAYRVESLQSHLKQYVSCLRTLYPGEEPSTIQHMSLHLPRFLELFGPVHSWWTYPFERLIGHLQHLPTNNKIGKSVFFLQFL